MLQLLKTGENQSSIFEVHALDWKKKETRPGLLR